MVNPYEACHVLTTELNVKVVSFKIGEADGQPLFLSWRKTCFERGGGFFFKVGNVDYPPSDLAAAYAADNFGDLLRGCAK